MENRQEQGMAAIKQARQYVKEGNFAFARDKYVEGLGILHRVYSEEKYAKVQDREAQKKLALKGSITKYLEEAQQNKANLEKKQAQLQHGWIGFPSKAPFLSPVNISNSQDTKVQQPPASRVPQQPTKMEIEQNKPERLPNPTNHRLSKPPNNAAEQLDPDVQQFLLTNLKNSFNDLVGMSDVTRVIQETIILPKLRPDLFEGLRAPPRGILLYGPPGNGKTFIAKVVASESGCSFFNLSASSLVSKFMGDSERMLRKIFAAAYKLSPSIIFVDEIDSILSSRKQNEEEHCRRLKTEFLTQMQGLNTSDSDHVIVIAATNLPQELDKAALRRFAKKIYIGVPSQEARIAFLQKILSQVPNNISKYDLEDICRRLEYYSTSDLNAVAAEACNLPVREVQRYLKTIEVRSIRNVSKQDFIEVISKIPPTLGKEELAKYVLHP